ncbi:MAG: 3-dehydroquinate dehydratase [Frankiales bacterium]|nr:3-dehydroquinate dehydratase [Frankiales bacterium]
MTILVLNGPNLGRLGTREPEVYGSTTYAELVQLCRDAGADDVRQTDDEATMIGWLHEAADSGADVVLNPAAWSHYSYALRDACSILPGRLVEVHLSQTHAREEFRHHSVISAVAGATITGLGVEGYRAALRYLQLP